jgi:DNA mismatch endonuclease (patch repair protein)
MADKLTAIERSRNMASIRSKDMKPELAARKAAHSLGFRFRLHRKDLPGKPDLVFPKYRAVIFVHGCFWHQHAEPSCLDGRPPKSNLAYWGPKLARNAARDEASRAQLEAQGWRVLVVWECETKQMPLLAGKIADFLKPRLMVDFPDVTTPHPAASRPPSPARGEGTPSQRARLAPLSPCGRGAGGEG